MKPQVDSQVDRLAELNAQIAKLEAEAKSIKNYLAVQYGAGSVYGLRYKASISIGSDSEVVSYRKAYDYLAGKVSKQIAANAIKKAMSVRKGSNRVAIYDIN